MRYELYYWPSIQGRGEFVRLALEEAGADYVDVARLPARHGMGMPALMRWLDGATIERPPFAPPYLKVGELVIGQTANILQYLGPRLGLAPRAEAGRIWTHQLQLTLADLINEIHDTHHPIASGLYYEDQKLEARRRTADFREQRLPKFLDYFEQVLQRNPRRGSYMVGARLSYVDLSVFQLIAGLRYAFPRLMTGLAPQYRGLFDLHDRVAIRPRIAAYLASKRRIAFNQQGIFRHYPELDQPL
ncbi:glutathione S-transferase [Undibacterium arcticum]|uniref:Glutathione S-transferase n=1 Tax=Undibacterium arcticum TaxID=1762892 RepID=A0ABV7EZ78_9BURK